MCGSDELWSELQDCQLSEASRRLAQKRQEINSLGEGLQQFRDAREAHLKARNFKSLNSYWQQTKQKLASAYNLTAHLNLLEAVNLRIVQSSVCDTELIRVLHATPPHKTPTLTLQQRHVLEETFLAQPDIKAHPVFDFILHEINNDSDIFRTLRLACLASLALNESNLQAHFQELQAAVQKNFGSECNSMVLALHELGLLCPNKKPQWGQIVQKMSLCQSAKRQSGKQNVPSRNSSNDSLRPSESAKTDYFAYQGYRPLSVQLLKLACEESWKDPKNVYKDPKTGRVLRQCRDEICRIPGAQFDGQLPEWSESQTNDLPVAILFFGGCTDAEISAIRRLSQAQKKKFMIFTTAVITGDDIIKQGDPDYYY